MKFTLEIDCDNAAFEDNGRETEVSSILYRLSQRLQLSAGGHAPYFLYDSNGNTVGEARFAKIRLEKNFQSGEYHGLSDEQS